MSKKERLFIILGIIFISFNLRAPITAVGSVVEMIATEFNLTSSTAGFITTLPLIAFAIVSPFVSTLSKKIGFGKAMMFGLILILVGELVRSYTNVFGLFMGTACIGVGIAIGNVLMPSIIKLKFGKHIGKMTSIYTSSMCIFAAVGAGVSIPLAVNLNWGWRNALAIWFVFTLVTVCIWLPQIQTKGEGTSQTTVHMESHTSIWKDKTAWLVTLFMGIQSLLFYCMVAWLPTIIMSKGLSQSFASNMALTYQLVAIPATLLIPVLCDKFQNQRGIVLVNGCIYLLGMAAFLLATSELLMIGSIVFLSLGMGGSISLSISFISLRSPNALKASQLSGMSQSAGYLLAAIGPATMGAIYDVTNSWSMPIIILITAIIVLTIIGLGAGQNVTTAE